MAPLDINTKITLPNGVKMPVLGFGVWDSPSHLTTQSCLEALKVGYRHIDTAQVYGNESEVGEAIKKSGVPRGDIFVTSKIISARTTAERTYESILESVKKCGGEGDDSYVDLFLVHNVTPGKEGVKAIWLALEKLHQEGKIKAIGVSNFGMGHIESMKEYATVWPPMVNQLELHPWTQQYQTVSYCQQNGICVQAYCPIVRNQKATDHVLASIAEKHSKSTPQVLLRWSLQKNWIPLPKSDNAKRIRENAEIFDFELDEGDMARLNASSQEEALVMVADNSARL